MLIEFLLDLHVFQLLVFLVDCLIFLYDFHGQVSYLFVLLLALLEMQFDPFLVLSNFLV